jgi:AraC-like DNA-binding protein
MLARTTKKIQVVAGECGFGNAVKLIRVFKQYVGTSPKRFRKEAVGASAGKREASRRNSDD